jgi:hypothetical protein
MQNFFYNSQLYIYFFTKIRGKKSCGIQRDPEKDDYIFSMTGKELLEKLKKLQKEGCDLSQKVCFVTKKNEKVEDLDLELMHVFYGEDFIELYSRGGKL